MGCLRTLHHISHLLVPRKCQLLLQEKPFGVDATLKKICHSEDGYAVRGNLPVGCRLYIGAYVAVKLYWEIATGLPALAMT